MVLFNNRLEHEPENEDVDGLEEQLREVIKSYVHS